MAADVAEVDHVLPAEPSPQDLGHQRLGGGVVPAHEHVVLAADVCLARCDGELAGYAFAEYIPSEVRLERCYVWGEVDPIHRGAGVGRDDARAVEWFEKAANQEEPTAQLNLGIMYANGRSVPKDEAKAAAL